MQLVRSFCLSTLTLSLSAALYDSTANDIIGNGSNGGHLYPTAETVLYNFLRMVFPATN